MEFLDENGTIIDTNVCEYIEQIHANRYIQSDDKVLELGVRYGTVAFQILNKVSSVLNYVGVEPDSRVWSSIDNNLKSFGKVNIVKGFISNSPLGLTELNCCNGYGTTSLIDSTSTIPHFSLQQIEDLYNIKFNVLVADCEGFLEQFLDENSNLYNEIRMILFEQDYPHKCNYEKIKYKLREHNFTMIEDGFQQVWKKY